MQEGYLTNYTSDRTALKFEIEYVRPLTIKVKNNNPDGLDLEEYFPASEYRALHLKEIYTK